MELGRYAEAEKLLRESLDIWRRVAGPENWWVPNTTKDLARVLSLEGRHAEAEKLARDAIDVSRRVFGPEDPLTAWSVYNLGAIELARGIAQRHCHSCDKPLTTACLHPMVWTSRMMKILSRCTMIRVS